MSTSTVMDPKNDARKIINILDENFELIKPTGKKYWYFERPLKVENGIEKKVAGVFKLAVKPSKETIEKFKNSPVGDFKSEDGTVLPMPDDEGKSIEELVKLIVRLKSGTDPSNVKWSNNEDFVNNKIFGDGTQVTKYLILADWAGLWNVADNRLGKKGTERFLHHPATKSKKSAKLSWKRDKGFFEDQYVKNWLDEWGTEDFKKFHLDLSTALGVLGLTPSQLAMQSGDFANLDPPAKLRKLKEILLPLRYWTENPNATNPVTHETKVIEDGEGANTGNRFHPKAILKGVDPNSIKRLATDVEPIIETEDNDTKKGKWKKGQTLVSDRNNSRMYNLVKVIRHFFSANTKAIGDQPKIDAKIDDGSSILSQEAIAVGQYGHIKMKWQQVLDMRDCLLTGMKNKQNMIPITKAGKTTKVVGNFDIKTIGGGSDKWSVESYWHDAFFLFMLGSTALGGRAEELFDIIANPPLDPESSGVEIIEEEDPPMYIVSVYTRKTEKMDDGKIHQAVITNSDDGDIVKDLIDTRLKDIKQKHGIITKITPQYKGGKVRDNKIHSLIGADGKYTRIDTIDLPTAKVKPTVRRKIVSKILRHCYEQAGLTDTFFYDRPIHSLRHVFAHYWLKKSGYNYNLVMKLGHWHNQKLLEGSYGQMDPAHLQNQIDIVARMDPSKSHRQIAEDREKETKSPTKRERKYTEASTKPSKKVIEVFEDISEVPV